MLTAPWRAFSDEIARWRDEGRRVDLWWRDDDATRPGPALSRLLALAADADVPLALAVVPHGAAAALLAGIGSGVDLIQHGVDHRNRAGAGEKKTEFPAAEPATSALARLAAGRSTLNAMYGERLLPVLAPPWNRFPSALLQRLAEAGFRGLTTFGARAKREPAPGLVQVNTHVDIIAWRRGRRFAGEDESLGTAIRHLEARRAGQVDPQEATGWLTHHAVHDEDAWGFLARLFDFTHGNPAVEWRRAEQFFTDDVTR